MFVLNVIPWIGRCALNQTLNKQKNTKNTIRASKITVFGRGGKPKKGQHSVLFYGQHSIF